MSKKFWDGDIQKRKQCACPSARWQTCAHPWFLRCAGCGEYFDITNADETIIRCIEFDDEWIDFCSVACADKTERRGTLINGITFGSYAPDRMN
jgi:hypothetical protein